MTLDQAARELVVVMDVVIACAGVVLSTAAVLIATAAELRLRAARPVTYAIEVPAGPAPATELFFTHLHSLTRREGWLSPAPELAIAAVAFSEGLRLLVSVPERFSSSLGASLDAIWPGAKLARIDAPPRPTATHGWHLTGTAIQRPATISSAAASFVRSLTSVSSGEQLSFAIALRRQTGRPWLLRGLVRDQSGRNAHRRPIEISRAGPLLAARVVVTANASTRPRARLLVRNLTPNVEALCTGTGIQLERPPLVRTAAIADGALAAPQLACVFPLGPLAAAALAISARESESGERLLGTRTTTGRATAEVRLSLAASRQHLHILGPTGMGKSTLLLNLAAQDINAGRGCAVLDPKGDLVHELLSRIPRRRLRDVVYIGPDERHRAVGINPLALGRDEDPHLAAENVLSIFKRIYEENWGPRTDDVLKSCLLALVGVPGATLAHIPALLTDPIVRKRFTARLDDDIGVGEFWRWYERLSEGKRLEVTAPLQNKLRDVLVRPRLRRLFCQSSSTVNLRKLMDEGGILLADLGTGRWGESASALAGSFLVSRLWQAALGRQSEVEEWRRDFLLYVDEFQSFLGIGGPFADALAQARALRLALTLANQHVGQLPRGIRDAVSANARNRVVFRSAAADASVLATEFAPLDAETLVALPAFTAAVRLAIGTSAFTMATFPALPLPPDVADSWQVLEASAARFGRDVVVVDRELRETLRTSDAPEEPELERTAP